MSHHLLMKPTVLCGGFVSDLWSLSPARLRDRRSLPFYCNVTVYHADVLSKADRRNAVPAILDAASPVEQQDATSRGRKLGADGGNKRTCHE